MNHLEIDPDAARQYIDARAAFVACERAQAEAAQVRGGMVWKAVKGADYLVHTSASGGQKGMGVRTPETEQVYERFQARKQRATERLREARANVARHERLNRALRVGRMPNIAVDLLATLADTGLHEHFRVVGTHALYAYETAAGMRLDSRVTTTNDIDLLWDTRRRLVFAEQLARSAPSMLAVLQKVDKSFALRPDQKYTAANDKGFEVDIIRREAVGGDPLTAPGFSEVVVGVNGRMARLSTLHPGAFAAFKRWMAEQPDRDPLKRRRDALQADAVAWLLQERLPQLQPQTAGPAA